MPTRFENPIQQLIPGETSVPRSTQRTDLGAQRSRVKLTVGTSIVASSTAIAAMRQTTPLELTIALSCLTVSLITCRALYGKAPRSAVALPLRTSAPMAIVRGLVFSAGNILASFVLLLVCTYLPSQDPIADWDRESVENAYDRLIQGDKEVEALELLDARLKHAASNKWKRELAQLLIDKLTQLGTTSDDRQSVRALNRAIELGRQFQLNTDRSKELLRKIEVDRSDADKVGTRIETLKDQIKDLVAKSHFDQAVSLLEAELASTNENDRQMKPLAELLIHSLVAWGDSLDSDSEREAKYSQAVDMAARWDINGAVPASRLAIVTAEKTTQPTDLPIGLTIQVVRTSQSNRAAAAVIDFTITNTSGAFIPGLREKDFRCLAGGQPVFRYAIHENRLTQNSKSASVVIGVETSRANQHQLRSLEDKVVQLVGQSGDLARYRLYAFSDYVHPLAGWTRDAQQVRRALQTAPRGHKSALREMIAVAATSLRDSQGDKILLLVTTGDDTRPSTFSDQAIQDLVIANGIRVIALKVGDLHRDSRLLTELIASSHGETYAIGHEDGLRAYFSRLGRSAVIPTYRFTLLEKSELRWPVEIFAGRQPNILSLRVDQSQVATSNR